MATNVFYRVPNGRGSAIVRLDSPQATLSDLQSIISERENFSHFRLLKYGRTLPENYRLLDGDSFLVYFGGLPGGKGGFGSMLRAIGAKIEKTSNRDACRDLSGRRLRDLNEEKRIKKWIARQAQLKKERERKAKEKIERIRRKLNPRVEFNDAEYHRVRGEIPTVVDEAIEYALKTKKSKAELHGGGTTPTTRTSTTHSETNQEKTIPADGKRRSVPLPLSLLPSTSNSVTEKSSTSHKRRSEVSFSREQVKKQKRSLWLGLDDDDECLSSEEDK